MFSACALKTAKYRTTFHIMNKFTIFASLKDRLNNKSYLSKKFTF